MVHPTKVMALYLDECPDSVPETPIPFCPLIVIMRKCTSLHNIRQRAQKDTYQPAAAICLCSSQHDCLLAHHNLRNHTGMQGKQRKRYWLALEG